MATAKRVTVVPNYNRDYKSKAAVKEDYLAGKDFKVQDFFSEWNGAAVNKEDADREGITLMIRYDKLTKQVASSEF